MTVTTKQCARLGCGKTFTVNHRQHMKLYCSDRCRWAAGYTARVARGEQRKPQPSRIRAYRKFADAFDQWLVADSTGMWRAVLDAREEVRLLDA